MIKTIYILYDERAIIDKESATVMCVSNSLEEARRDADALQIKVVIYKSKVEAEPREGKISREIKTEFIEVYDYKK